jgi:hemolysin activation/secretion protein
MAIGNLIKNKMNVDGKKLRVKLALGLLFASVTVNTALAAGAPNTADMEEQNRHARQEAVERQAREGQQDVRLQQGQKTVDDTSLPDEKISFAVKTIKLDGDRAELFPWAQELLDQYQGRKIGMQGINLIVKKLTNVFIDRGYITTRVIIPEQNLSSGELRLVLVPGIIHSIRFEDPAIRGNWRTAFPTRPGDLLNLRRLEQGLEQMKRVPSQDVDMKLVPGDKPGETDVVITVKRSNSWSAVLSLDDSGIKSTGKLQFAQTVSVDNLFNANDLFHISFNNDVECNGPQLGTKGDSIYYSIPYGESTFTFSKSSYRYHQTIAFNTQNFLSWGKSDDWEFKLKQLIDRDQVQKTYFEFGIVKKHSRSYINDTEIELQRKNTTAAEFGINHRHYFGPTTLDITLTYKKGVPWFGAQTDIATADNQTTRYNMELADIVLSTPLTLGQTQGRYKLTLSGQYTDDTLYQTDMISIGNRYTVRGFDGEQTLSAERGWYMENELSLPLGDTGMEGYAGLDYGQVCGPSAKNLTGRILAGAVVGLRGGKNVQYDVFVGWPLRKPDGFTTAKQTFGFQLIYQI